MMHLALATVWHDRRRFVPIAVVVTVAGLLIMAQIAVAGGVFRDAAAPVNRSSAQLWAGPEGAGTLLEGSGLDADRASVLWTIPELVGFEPYAIRYGDLSDRAPGGASVDVGTEAQPRRFVMAILLDTNPLAALYATHLPPGMRAALADPETIVIGEEDAALLGVHVGDRVWFDDRPMRVVGTLPGMQGLGISTALIGTASWTSDDRAMFWLLSLEPGTPDARVAAIARDATRASGLSVMPAAELAQATISAFVWTSGAGTVLLSTSGLALVVAAMVVSQVMRAAVLAAVREYAALGAFGIGSRRLVRLVLLQGCLVAVVSVAVTAVFTMALLEVLARASIPHALPLWLAGPAMAALCAVLAASTVLATRHLRHADPASLLR